MVAGALAVGLLAGCGSGPSQVGAAAIVGDRIVPIEQVQQQLRTVLEKEGEEAKAQLVAGRQLDDVSRQIVTLAVQHELLAEAAERERLSVSEQRVTAMIDRLGGARAASAGSVFTVENFRDRARDQLLAVELGRKYLPGLAVTVDYTTADTRGAAMQRVAELSAAGSERARELIRADVDQGAAAALDQEIIASENPGFASAPVFGVGKGTVVAFPSDEQAGTWLVMVVTGRSTDGGSGQPARKGEIDAMDRSLIAAAGIRQLAPVAEDVGVRLNPRYGVWDAVSLQTAPNENETTGFVAPLREVPPT
ncbi:MAG: SurA N-terminal domain-containing protein [Pseudonocardiaceae bacterium]